MKIDLLPLAGVLASFGLFVMATLRYPGGYDWNRDYICTLFAQSTASGAANEARYSAAAAMFVLCASVAVLFKLLSRRGMGTILRKTLEIGGIGSMVYAFFVVTPLHDLVLAIALVFFVPAMLAALYLASLEGRRALFWSGLMCLGLLLAGVAMHYGKLLLFLLPFTQKSIFATTPGWLLALQLAPWKRTADDPQVVSCDGVAE